MNSIRLIISGFSSILLLISCTGSQGDSKTNIIETKIEKNTDSIIPNEFVHAVKNKKSEDKYPKVLTYLEIIEKNKDLQKDYEKSKEYSTDTIVRRKIMNKSFYNYLTT